MLKNPTSKIGARRQNSAMFLTRDSPASPLGVTDVPVGLIRVPRTRLIVGLITPHLTYLTIMKPVREAKARCRAVVPLMIMMMMMITYVSN
jgi:hypothetical protein